MPIFIFLLFSFYCVELVFGPWVGVLRCSNPPGSATIVDWPVLDQIKDSERQDLSIHGL